MAAGDPRKTCFVIMGFGEKTDFQATPQRLLDLNRTFEDIIQPAVTECGVECIRADKIIHSTVIDKPMYEQLLGADLVIADLSTSNANAIYELGVRHALRPHTTIVIAKKGFAFPFDLSHLSILKYEHLGKEIGFREVMRMRDELKQRFPRLLERRETDSPAFLFLPDLRSKDAPATTFAQIVAHKLGVGIEDVSVPPAPQGEDPHATRGADGALRAAGSGEKSFADLMDEVKRAKKAVRVPADWLAVVDALGRLKALQPADPYIIQQLALATYKSRQPDALRSLQQAASILEALSPETSCEAETVGLWGSIHKRLWEVDPEPSALDHAIRAYARGYFIKNDYYNAINFAFLLDVRARRSQGDEGIADRVVARRIRGEALVLCDAVLASDTSQPDDRFWASATKVEALLGLGRAAESEALRQQLVASQPPPAPWMIDSMNEQLAKLAALGP